MVGTREVGKRRGVWRGSEGEGLRGWGGRLLGKHGEKNKQENKNKNKMKEYNDLKKEEIK